MALGFLRIHKYNTFFWFSIIIYISDARSSSYVPHITYLVGLSLKTIFLRRDMSSLPIRKLYPMVPRQSDHLFLKGSALWVPLGRPFDRGVRNTDFPVYTFFFSFPKAFTFKNINCVCLRKEHFRKKDGSKGYIAANEAVNFIHIHTRSKAKNTEIF
jgi:hypothetical protein